MTAVQSRSTTLPYGMRELRMMYEKYAAIGLVLAVTVHLAAIGGYFIGRSNIENPAGTPDKVITLIDWCPPSIPHPDPPVGNPDVQRIAGAERGTPIPVPDPDVSLEQTLADQANMNPLPTGIDASSGTEIGIPPTPSTAIEDEDPPPFQAVEIDPKLVSLVKPDYPELAREIGLEGVVWVKMLVARDGRVKKVSIARCETDVFNEAALAAAKQCIFTPAIMNGNAVAVWVTMPYRFALQK
jgi:TonB family protein